VSAQVVDRVKQLSQGIKHPRRGLREPLEPVPPSVPIRFLHGSPFVLPPEQPGARRQTNRRSARAKGPAGAVCGFRVSLGLSDLYLSEA
jgi:hypothetical protein